MYIDPKKHKLEKRQRREREILRSRPVDHCPGCWYDLTGLTDHPCPECGMGQSERAEIYAQLEREHRANLIGLRACFELWRPVTGLGLFAAAMSRTWLSIGFAIACITMLYLTHRVSSRAQNPMDTLAEMNRFSSLRLQRRAWAALNMMLMVAAAVASIFLILAGVEG